MKNRQPIRCRWRANTWSGMKVSESTLLARISRIRIHPDGRRPRWRENLAKPSSVMGGKFPVKKVAHNFPCLPCAVAKSSSLVTHSFSIFIPSIRLYTADWLWCEGRNVAWQLLSQSVSQLVSPVELCVLQRIVYHPRGSYRQKFLKRWWNYGEMRTTHWLCSLGIAADPAREVNCVRLPRSRFFIPTQWVLNVERTGIFLNVD